MTTLLFVQFKYVLRKTHKGGAKYPCSTPLQPAHIYLHTSGSYVILALNIVQQSCIRVANGSLRLCRLQSLHYDQRASRVVFHYAVIILPSVSSSREVARCFSINVLAAGSNKTRHISSLSPPFLSDTTFISNRRRIYKIICHLGRLRFCPGRAFKM